MNICPKENAAREIEYVLAVVQVITQLWRIVHIFGIVDIIPLDGDIGVWEIVHDDTILSRFHVIKPYRHVIPVITIILPLGGCHIDQLSFVQKIVKGDRVMIVYSTFDEQPTKHKFVSEMTIEHAKRLVEAGEDVFILLDSITRLSRAYNLTEASSGKTLSGGLDPNALYMPKRFFGAARKTKERGSLTILATALVDTGSKMDDVIYEEFKGTGNMELILSRKLQERRLFPAIDIAKSGTRREDLLLSRDEQNAVNIIRRDLMNYYRDDSIDGLIELFIRTRNNDELVQLINKNKSI